MDMPEYPGVLQSDVDHIVAKLKLKLGSSYVQLQATKSSVFARGSSGNPMTRVHDKATDIQDYVTAHYGRVEAGPNPLEEQQRAETARNPAEPRRVINCPTWQLTQFPSCHCQGDNFCFFGRILTIPKHTELPWSVQTRSAEGQRAPQSLERAG